jgi:predicted lipid-binding transport protein (Tim44 family)
LALVSGLTIGDYLLWNWSLNANHDVLSLISGLTLPPLVIACLWLLAVGVARGLARTTRRPPVTASRGRASHGASDTSGARRRAARQPSAATGDPAASASASAAGAAESSASAPTPASSRKLAA